MDATPTITTGNQNFKKRDLEVYIKDLANGVKELLPLLNSHTDENGMVGVSHILEWVDKLNSSAITKFYCDKSIGAKRDWVGTYYWKITEATAKPIPMYKKGDQHYPYKFKKRSYCICNGCGAVLSNKPATIRRHTQTTLKCPHHSSSADTKLLTKQINGELRTKLRLGAMDLCWEGDKENVRATLIQRAYRRYLVRKTHHLIIGKPKYNFSHYPTKLRTKTKKHILLIITDFKGEFVEIRERCLDKRVWGHGHARLYARQDAWYQFRAENEIRDTNLSFKPTLKNLSSTEEGSVIDRISQIPNTLTRMREKCMGFGGIFNMPPANWDNESGNQEDFNKNIAMNCQMVSYLPLGDGDMLREPYEVSDIPSCIVQGSPKLYTNYSNRTAEEWVKSHNTIDSFKNFRFWKWDEHKIIS